MKLIEGLNERQQLGVLATDGPVLILAGAGSGKTRTIIHRIAYILKEEKAKPWQILALTFTNKAAEEMRSRIREMDIEGTEDIWMSTFHSMCAKVLRFHANLLGYDRNYVIYDMADVKTILKETLTELNLDEKMYPVSMLIGRISSLKEKGIMPADFEKESMGDYREEKISSIYKLYQNKLVSNNAMDFDDLLLNTVRLFEENEEILEYYQKKFKYVLVDEYQDTNPIQFKLTDMLAKGYKNICVCGDDDQSIYAFRGADIRNILEFEKNYPEAKVIKLEQNYRSTPNIIEAANHVICNNDYRKDKKMWTDRNAGDIIEVYELNDERDESNYITNEIRNMVRDGKYDYRDFAVLYRTNAQSRVFEESFMAARIPYKMVGGTKFYVRAEIKDIIAYLIVLDNGKDDLSLKRIINTPKRGIGGATIDKLEQFAKFKGWPLYEVIKNLDEMVGLSAGVMGKLRDFADLMIRFAQLKEEVGVSQLLERVIDESGYMDMLESGKMQNAQSRAENLKELVSAAVEFEKNSMENDLTSFLENVSLYAETDNIEETGGEVLLMTIHNAKGLEFPVVFLPGMEEGIFPHERSKDNDVELQEERRLCYVGITRACDKLYMTHARYRTVYGRLNYNMKSRFLDEIPNHLVNLNEMERETVQSKPKKGVQDQTFSMNSQMGRFKKANTASLQPSSSKGDDAKAGDKIAHKIWGEGTVININGDIATVAFPQMGIKKIALSMAPIKILQG
ncbi:DNA helicase PcrA [Alkalibacter saccharofermentans]|uniref:ATP-dependent DNA helicase n=1 Tax=Alkalibacter saccharofermentans DSM 14828 TaxID=1120975 RepID=A0A1M4ZNE3_9FIRM|nr:DNA helicase PcrA [Alkalibacter saccharofermentans]SHF19096.1 DNA helicase-2 / ATP-dependent DNA helicase PcrA [Alkalibacter saccharofermentans DSM 14828]